MTPEQIETIKDLLDASYAYWVMLNSGLRSAQLQKDTTSVIQFTNEVKIVHGVVSGGIRLLRDLGTTPRSFQIDGNIDSKPLDKPMDDEMPSQIIMP